MVNLSELKKIINEKTANSDFTEALKEIYIIIEDVIEKEPWYEYLIKDKFTIDELLKYYYSLNDDDDTIWEDNTPDDIKEIGEKEIESIRDLLYEQD